MQRDLSGLSLSYIHKLSVLRLAVDLIKADNLIFGEEVAVLTDLQQQFGLTQQDVDGIHYITLQQAVESLKDLGVEAADMIVALLNDIMCVDNDIDYDENILLTSVKMSISQKSKSWCNVISTTNVMDETSQKQIMYLEDSPCEAAHKVFNVGAVALCGRDSARRGMWLFEIAHALERVHFVTERCARNVEIGVCGQVFRADRIAGCDICVDDRLEYRFFAFAEFHLRVCSFLLFLALGLAVC